MMTNQITMAYKVTLIQEHAKTAFWPYLSHNSEVYLKDSIEELQ